jgi:hypothetical protein
MLINSYSCFQFQSNAGISCGRVRRPGGPARRVLRRRRDGSGRQLHAELYESHQFNMPPKIVLIMTVVLRVIGQTHRKPARDLSA